MMAGYSFSVTKVPGQEIRFCWVDEDGERISPVHNDVGKALSFCADWQLKHDRLEVRAQEVTEAFQEAQSQATVRGEPLPEYRIQRSEQDAKKFQEAREKLTLTGKPPAKLMRLAVRITLEDPIEIEQQMAALELAKIS